MAKRLILWASALGATGVMLGAMGAHALKAMISPEQLNSFETGVRYQLIHALVMLAMAGFADRLNPKLSAWAFRLFLLGTVLFSVSIYLLSTQTATGLSVGFLGPVTPLGGLSLITGWILLALSALKSED